MSDWKNSPDEFDNSEFLQIEKTPVDTWVASKFDYTSGLQTISLYHIFPNDGKHVSVISYTEDTMVISECACNPTYEAVGDEIIIVHESDELEPDEKAIEACIADSSLAPIFESSNDEE